MLDASAMVPLACALDPKSMGWASSDSRMRPCPPAVISATLLQEHGQNSAWPNSKQAFALQVQGCGTNLEDTYTGSVLEELEDEDEDEDDDERELELEDDDEDEDEDDDDDELEEDDELDEDDDELEDECDEELEDDELDEELEDDELEDDELEDGGMRGFQAHTALVYLEHFCAK